MRWVVLIAGLVSSLCAAQTPVYIPFAPGGTVDVTFRHVQRYAAAKGVTLTPVYKPGAEGLIGINEFAKANDASFMITSIGVIAEQRAKNPELAGGVKMLTGVKVQPYALVTHPNSGIVSAQDLVAKMRSGRSFTYGVSSAGLRMTTEQFFQLVSPLQSSIIVAYKGGAPAVVDLLGGHIDVMFIPMVAVRSHVDAEKLKLLMLTSRRKFAEYPSVAYVYDVFPKWENFDGHVVLVNQRTSQENLSAWSSLFAEYLADPQTQQDFSKELNEALTFGDTSTLSRRIDIMVRWLMRGEQSK